MRRFNRTRRASVSTFRWPWTAERIRRDAQAGVAQELRRAQSELREEAADLALEIAARKLSEQVGEADRERLVDEFILRVEANSGEGADR